MNLMQEQLEGEEDPTVGPLYRAGQRVGPGIYRQVDGPRVAYLGKEGYLPASLDGRVACYRRVQYTWDRWDEAKQRGAGTEEFVFAPGKPAARPPG